MLKEISKIDIAAILMKDLEVNAFVNNEQIIIYGFKNIDGVVYYKVVKNHKAELLNSSNKIFIEE